MGLEDEFGFVLLLGSLSKQAESFSVYFRFGSQYRFSVFLMLQKKPSRKTPAFGLKEIQLEKSSDVFPCGPGCLV